MFLAATILFVIAFILVYKRIQQSYNYWSERCVVFEEPTFLFGCLKDFFFGTKSNYEIICEIYKKHDDAPFVGIFQGTQPTLLIRDPELIKHILVKDFNSFHSRGITTQETDVLTQNVLFVAGKKWKLLRQKLMPAFTPSKLKNMTPLIADSGSKLTEHLHKQLKKDDLNIRTTIADFTTSVITSCAFGIESKTLSDNDTPFRNMGRFFFEQNPKINKAIMLDMICPSIYKYISYSRFRSVDKLFITLFKKVMRDRETANVKRNDFIDICVDLKKIGNLKDPDSVGDYTLEVTDDLLAAQAFFFFLAGHETSETSITFALYELAHNKIYLDKVHEEVDTLLKKHGSLNYECLEEAVYLERVVKETQRKYPPIAFLQRECNSEYTIPKSKVTLGVGCYVIIPIMALHRDEKYFKEPRKFDPDRFLNICPDNSFVYLPFGNGPRQCLGLRLAMLQVKAGLFSLLSQFTLESQGSYDQYLELQPIFLALKPKALNIKVVPRKF